MRPASSAARLLPIIATLIILTAFFCYGRIALGKEPVLAAAAAELEALRPQGIEQEPFITASALFSYELGEADISVTEATVPIKLCVLDTAALCAELEEPMQAYLSACLSEADSTEGIYDDSGSYLEELCIAAYNSAVSQRLSHAGDYLKAAYATLRLERIKGEWTAVNLAELTEGLFPAQDDMPGFSDACARLVPYPIKRPLPDLTSPAPQPDSEAFGSTDDSAELAALLQSPKAQRIIGDRTLTWSESTELLPNSLIYWYLDDSILSIVWQEEELGAVATFAETIITDATQLRRKLAGDSYGSLELYTPSTLAAQANAVLGISGDFYTIAGRNYGVYVYDGEVKGFNAHVGQSCYFTSEGDMLLSYENSFEDKAQAQSFVDENGIMFSLNFGPVIIDKGIDVTPYDYVLGEVREGYARCTIAQMGKLHYLAMTVNVDYPNYTRYITLKQATELLIKRGCQRAYTLDGGQTATIVMNGQVINPVQFYEERPMSDIFYFATALEQKTER